MSAKLKYMVQLDTLRAVSIILVLMQHFSPVKSFFGSEGIFPLGFIGVDIFFVLSGFLISRSLIKEREDKIPLYKKAIRFTSKRALRLFPVYYVVLLVAVCFNYYDIQSYWLWMFGYASNFLAAVEGHPTWGFTQFWSLAVEEQFYLFWPWMVWLISGKKIKNLFIAFILSGILVRTGMYLLDCSPISIRFSTFALFDLFGMGALLAYIHTQGEAHAKTKLINSLACFGLAGMFIIIISRVLMLPGLSSPAVSLIFFSFFGSFVYVSLVHHMALGIKTHKWFFENQFLIYVGKISYGIYIYHNFVKDLLPKTIEYFGYSMSGVFIFDFTLLSAVTILVSGLSWKLIEQPFLRLKARL